MCLVRWVMQTMPLLNLFKLLVAVKGKKICGVVVYEVTDRLVLPSLRVQIEENCWSADHGGRWFNWGGAGIRLAAKCQGDFTRRKNRVILARMETLIWGVHSNGARERLIERKDRIGVFLKVRVLAWAIQRSKMEGGWQRNGNLLYIDSILEAKKRCQWIWSTLFTIAKRCKVQVEFNPAKVRRCWIGYENTNVKAGEKFHNTKKMQVNSVRAHR